MVVRDLVGTAKAGLDVAWLLHTANEPAIAGNRATASAGGGRLHCVSLLPAGAEMTSVGGAGREFEVAGENFAPARVRESDEPGSWRIEVVSRAASPGRHELLHVLFIADVEDAALPDARLVECSRGRALAAGGVLFVFAEGAAAIDLSLAEPVSAALVLELDGAGRLDIEGPVSTGGSVTASASAYLAGALPAGAYRIFAR